MKVAVGGGTVERAIALLRMLAESDRDLTIKDAAAALCLAPSTAHRLLDLLCREGMVERDDKRHRYRSGVDFFRIAGRLRANYPVRRVVLPIMRAIVEECDETCLFCLYLPTTAQMIFAERIDSTQLLRYRVDLNVPLPVPWGASGLSFMAHLPSDEIGKIEKRKDPSPATGQSLPQPEALARILLAIRQRGYAITHGQKVAGAVGIAAAVFDADGRAIGSIGLTIPEFRFGPGEEARLGNLVKVQSDALSRALGYRSTRPLDLDATRMRLPAVAS